MANKPRIFISAVSSEFKQLRQLIAQVLERLGYEPVYQNIFGTEPGDLRQMLKNQIDDCMGLIHVVGRGYGAEPPTADAEFGRVSYTQFELLYAQRTKKTTWVLFADEGCTRDKPLDELDLPTAALHDAAVYQSERRALQDHWRERLCSEGHLWHSAKSDLELELRVERLRNEFAELRRAERKWRRAMAWSIAGVAALLVILLVVSFKLVGAQSQTSKTAEKSNERVEDVKNRIEKVDQSIQGMQGDSKIEAASARLQRAMDEMNLGNRGQVEALELLVANGRTYPNATFEGVWLQGAKLNGADFSSARFIDAELNNTQFVKANITDASIFLATADHIDASESKAAKLRFQMTDANAAKFDGADLTQASFYFSKLPNSSFRGANCTAANFAHADLTNADFRNSDLTDAVFIGSVIDGAQFDGAIFHDTDMSAAMTTAMRVTDAQRSGMCRSMHLPPRYVAFRLQRSIKNATSGAGEQLASAFDVPLGPILGAIHGSLRARKSEPPRPRSFNPWDNAPQFRLDATFLDVGNRQERFQQRIATHGAWLIAKSRELPTVEGNDKEFADWMAELRHNALDTKHAISLPLNVDTVLVIALNQGVRPQDIDDNEWYSEAANRYDSESTFMTTGVVPSSGLLFGWPRLYPEKYADYQDLPPDNAEVYRDWTVRRAKVMETIDVNFSMRLDGDKNTQTHGEFPIFQQYSLSPTPAGIKIPPEILTIEGLEHWLPIQIERPPPEWLRTENSIFSQKRVLMFKEPVGSYSFLPDSEVNYPINVSVVARVASFKHIAPKHVYDGFVEVITVNPTTILLTGSDNKQVTGKLKFSDISRPNIRLNPSRRDPL